jgi:hypothetical protein
MLIVIAITGIVALLIGLMMTQYFMRRSATQSAIRDVQNFYTAESGIRKAFYYLSKDETKGIQWRTGDLLDDSSLVETIFHNRDDRVEISVIDDCGYVRIRSRVKVNPPKTVETLCAGRVPNNLKYNLHLVAPKPLILVGGSHISGKIKVNHEPLFHGGTIDGIIETSTSLSLPPVLTKPFGKAIRYFRHMLSTPTMFEVELFSPQVFSLKRPFPAKRIFVNDMVLIESESIDSLWYAARGITLASTAEVQISGTTRMSHATIIAIGPVKVMDQAELKSSKIYSESSIEIREQTRFSGMLFAPDIKVSERAELQNSSLLYSGSPFKNGRIKLESETPAYCNVFNLCAGKNSLLKILKQTRLEGFIYTCAPFTLRGEVSGYVFSHGFYEDPVTQDTTNTNIISGIIRPAQSTHSLFLPLVFQDINDFKILEWIEY